MPKHLSGDQMVHFLEERQQKKLQEEEEKMRRKEEKELRKKQKEETKRKQLEKETKGREREIRKSGRGRVTQPASKSCHPRMAKDPEPSISLISDKVIYSSDNDAICPACFTKEDKVWPWIAYDCCEEWYTECTKISPDLYPDLHSMD